MSESENGVVFSGIAIIGFIVLVSIFVVFVVAFDPDERNKQEITEQAKAEMRSHFTLVKRLEMPTAIFDKDHSRMGQKVFVIQDRETGVKYLYIWGGGYQGGPAITRYWEKGEGEVKVEKEKK